MDENLNFFNHSENVFLFPKYIDESEKVLLKAAWSSLDLTNHIFLCSSGTSSKQGTFKSYAISKKAILANAKCVNALISASDSDTWLGSLPTFHIGGISIYARAYLSGSSILHYDQKWDPQKFFDILAEGSINFFSLVPTQLYDLITLKRKCPISIKAVFIGGDHFPSKLKEQALNLGYPLIVTYGMTEVSSQFASAYQTEDSDEFLEVFPIHNIEREYPHHIESPALATYEILTNKNGDTHFKDLKGNFYIQDHLDFSDREGKLFIRPLGRADSQIKIKGRLYNFLELQNTVHNYFIENDLFDKAVLQYVNHDRDGKRLRIFIEESVAFDLSKLKSFLSSSLPSPVLPVSITTIKLIPRNSLNKVQLPD